MFTFTTGLIIGAAAATAVLTLSKPIYTAVAALIARWRAAAIAKVESKT